MNCEPDFRNLHPVWANPLDQSKNGVSAESRGVCLHALQEQGAQINGFIFGYIIHVINELHA